MRKTQIIHYAKNSDGDIQKHIQVFETVVAEDESEVQVLFAEIPAHNGYEIDPSLTEKDFLNSVANREAARVEREQSFANHAQEAAESFAARRRELQEKLGLTDEEMSLL